MTINVHEDHPEIPRDRERYVEVAVDHYHLTKTLTGVGKTEFDRFDLADPATTCLRPMRGWNSTHQVHDHYDRNVGTREHVHHGFCLLDKDHKGRHSTVVFYCDGCERTLRGEAHASHRDEGVAFCYLCSTGVRY
jgi:hypothetical protein